MTTLKLLSGAAIDKGIEACITASAKLGPDIHKYAVQALLHARPESEGGYNDPRKLDRLVKGLHKSNAPTALKSWAERYSPIRWNGDDKVGILKETSPKYIPFDCQAASEDPYWERIPAVAKPLTLAALRAMVAQMEKKLSKDDVVIAEGENVTVLRAYVARMKAADEAAANASVAASTTVVETQTERAREVA